MSKIKLNNNTELNVLNITGSSIFYQGSNRDCLQLYFDSTEYTFDYIDGLFADRENTKKITVIQPSSEVAEDGQPVNTESVYTDYILRTNMEKKPVVITPATVESPEVTEERIIVHMAQLSYLEKQLAGQQSVIDDILVSMVEV